jgi:hypothetical protein
LISLFKTFSPAAEATHLAKRKLADDRLESFDVFAVRETKDVVLTDSAAIQCETVTESAQIIEEIYCLILWHSDPVFVAILHD